MNLSTNSPIITNLWGKFTMIKKLKFMPYAQAQVIEFDDGSMSLISYTTSVAHLSKNGFLTVYGLHSMTTRRHIGAFIKEYSNGTIDYSFARKAYDGNYSINIFTGEVLQH